MPLKHTLTAILFLLIYTNILSSHPIITRILPNCGPTEGGNIVAIQGSRFKSDRVTAIKFGSTPASFSILDDDQILATAPMDVAGTVQISVITDTGSSHTNEEAFYAYQGSWYAYLVSPSTNHITPLNLITHLPEPPIPIGRSPAHMVIAPNGKMAYLTDSSLNAVIPMNLLTYALETPIPVDESPTHLAIHPNGKTIYVINEESATLSVIDVATHTSKLSILIGNHPKDIAIPFNGLTAYVSDGINSVIPINLIKNAPGKPIPVGTEPTSLIIDYNGQMLYVLNKGSNTVTPITIATHMPGKPIPLKMASDSLTITPDGEFIYVIHTEMDCITPISLPDYTVLPSIPVGEKPKEIAMTPDGEMAYVICEGSHEITPLILATQTLESPIPTEFPASSLVITPDPAPIASYTYALGEAETPTLFDASASVTPVGFLTHYIWDFGDETIQRTYSPIISHTYQRPGLYHVTLTVINSAGTSQFTIFNSRTPSHHGGPSSSFKKSIQIPNSTKERKEINEKAKEEEPPQANLSSPPLPPSEFKGKIIKSKKSSPAFQHHRLKWKGSPDPRVIGYKLYRNRQLIKKFPNKKFFVFNQYGWFKKRTTYSLVSFDKNGQKSSPLILTLR